jgi:small subunit ribosomal protein S6
MTDDFPLADAMPIARAGIPVERRYNIHMKREYELGIVIPSSVLEQDTQAVIEGVKTQVATLGGEVTNVDYWGRRRLAYPIQDFREGYYAFLMMEFPTEQLPELERLLHLNDQVIRHLVVRPD